MRLRLFYETMSLVTIFVTTIFVFVNNINIQNR